jgi:hypothetical protein
MLLLFSTYFCEIWIQFGKEDATGFPYIVRCGVRFGLRVMRIILSIIDEFRQNWRKEGLICLAGVNEIT